MSAVMWSALCCVGIAACGASENVAKPTPERGVGDRKRPVDSIGECDSESYSPARHPRHVSAEPNGADLGRASHDPADPSTSARHRFQRGLGAGPPGDLALDRAGPLLGSERTRNGE